METDAHHTILMVDDDPDDFFLAKEASRHSGLRKTLQMLQNGDDLMDYLYRRGKFAHLQHNPLPCLILLDLNMPGKDGREILKELKGDPNLRRIPIVIFSTSSDEQDVSRCRELGADAYITKPSEFDRLVEIMSSLERHCLNQPCLANRSSPLPRMSTG